MKHAVKSHISGNNCLTLELHGAFGFELVSEFRSAYEDHPQPVRQYIVDLGRCEGITSAGLGMLLQLHRWVNNSTTPIIITGCNKSISTILEISKFDKFFTINPTSDASK